MNPNRLGGEDTPQLLEHTSWTNSARMLREDITVDNALDYFCHQENPFYDKNSENQWRKMQGHNDHSGQSGKRYVLYSSKPPSLFVIGEEQTIRTQNTDGKGPTENIHTFFRTFYYIINGIVYKCPDLSSLTYSRLANVTTNLHKAVDEMSKFIKFKRNEGYTWNFDNESTDKTEKLIEQSSKEELESKREHEEKNENYYKRYLINELLNITLK
ncbi:hypothetical protein SNEBB_000867 [Seison nebaliae]|nr:hypothetical protein SNEBB_000867 [Seison nebaliae]